MLKQRFIEKKFYASEIKRKNVLNEYYALINRYWIDKYTQKWFTLEHVVNYAFAGSSECKTLEDESLVLSIARDLAIANCKELQLPCYTIESLRDSESWYRALCEIHKCIHVWDILPALTYGEQKQVISYFTIHTENLINEYVNFIRTMNGHIKDRQKTEA